MHDKISSQMFPVESHFQSTSHTPHTTLPILLALYDVCVSRVMAYTDTLSHAVSKVYIHKHYI